MIEYVNAAWNPYTGCLHGEAECPVYAECWARDMSHRFRQVCGGNFKPRYHPDRLELPRHWRKRRRVAVCFMSELGGYWPKAEDAEHRYGEEPVNMSWVRRSILGIARACPQHTFLFLTKNPAYYAEFNPWPSNAWVGITLTGAEPPERQAAMWAALQSVQGAGVYWLSYEPAIAPLAQMIPDRVGWVVVGGWSQGGSVSLQGITRAILRAEQLCIPRWEKSNLSDVLEAPLHQEVPHA